jgi:hypothetical protein
LELGADGEALEPHLVLKDRKRSRKELEALLKHELIHYELRDHGGPFYGHGAAFLKRAQELGIVNSYVLQRCFSSEEYEHTPTVRKTKKLSLSAFKRQVDHWFVQLLGELVRLPDPYSTRLYPHVQNAYVGWLAYSAAVKERAGSITQEVWQIKKGRRGKDLHQLQNEYGVLKKQGQRLLNRLKRPSKHNRNEAARRQLKSVDAALAQIRRKVKQDYGILLS